MKKKNQTNMENTITLVFCTVLAMICATFSPLISNYFINKLSFSVIESVLVSIAILLTIALAAFYLLLPRATKWLGQKKEVEEPEEKKSESIVEKIIGAIAAQARLSKDKNEDQDKNKIETETGYISAEGNLAETDAVNVDLPTTEVPEEADLRIFTGIEEEAERVAVTPDDSDLQIFADIGETSEQVAVTSDDSDLQISADIGETTEQAGVTPDDSDLQIFADIGETSEQVAVTSDDSDLQISADIGETTEQAGVTLDDSDLQISADIGETTEQAGVTPDDADLQIFADIGETTEQAGVTSDDADLQISVGIEETAEQVAETSEDAEQQTSMKTEEASEQIPVITEEGEEQLSVGFEYATELLTVNPEDIEKHTPENLGSSEPIFEEVPTYYLDRQSDISELLDRALESKNRRNYEDAISAYESALVLNPDDELCYLIILDLCSLYKITEKNELIYRLLESARCKLLTIDKKEDILRNIKTS
ncbi:MAG: hypothetical protein ACOYIF_03845 [Acetivibrionales bacterium]